jgi:sec-independent protein translocase protein TatA
MSFGPEWFVVLGVIVLLFGAKKLPELARSLGRSTSEFKKGIKEGTTETTETDEAGEAGGQAPKADATPEARTEDPSK